MLVCHCDFCNLLRFLRFSHACLYLLGFQMHQLMRSRKINELQTLALSVETSITCLYNLRCDFERSAIALSENTAHELSTLLLSVIALVKVG